MRRLTAIAMLLALLGLAGGYGLADQRSGEERLNGLFAELRETPDQEAAREVEEQIWEIWISIDDEASARLMRRGQFLMRMHAFERAEDSFTKLVERDPGYAEAWNKRATLRFMMGDLDDALLDIQKVLELEPRHFGALSGMGLVFMRLDQPDAALKSFEAALDVHPHLPAAKAHADMLRDRVIGRPI